MFSTQNSQMLAQAREARFQPKFIVQILLFIAVYMVGSSIASVFQIVPMIIGMCNDQSILNAIVDGNMPAFASLLLDLVQQPRLILFSLFGTVAVTLCCFFYCRKIERRSWGSLGFKKQGWLLRYVKGYAIGTTMLLLCALILWMKGDLDFAFSEKIPVFYILTFFVGFLIQGMSEEVLIRGYLMVSLTNRCHKAVAVGISSVIFAALHLFNPGITLLAVPNLILFGVFMAVYILRTDDLLGACAIHSAWNFAQGNLVGIKVSGMAQLPTVAVMNPIGESSLFHGGSFGLEGGLIVTFMLLVAIALTLFLPKKAEAV